MFLIVTSKLARSEQEKPVNEKELVQQNYEFEN